MNHVLWVLVAVLFASLVLAVYWLVDARRECDRHADMLEWLHITFAGN